VKIIVQIRNKVGERIERFVVTERGITIGRGWDNDVIIQDKYVDEHHLTLCNSESVESTRANKLVVSEQGTSNGTRIAGQHIVGEKIEVGFGEPVYIGDTKICFFDPAQTVDKAVIKPSWVAVHEKLTSNAALALLTFATLVLSLLNEKVFSSEKFDVSDGIESGFSVLVVLLLWSMLFGFISKVIRGESNLRMHWVIGCIAVLVLELISLLVDITLFNLQSPTFGKALSSIIYGAFSLVLIVSAFTYSTFLSKKAKWLSAFCIVVVSIGIVHSKYFLKEEHELWNSGTQTEKATYPPAFLFREPVELDQYMLDAERLFEFETDA